jgi:hypothetical protein
LSLTPPSILPPFGPHPLSPSPQCGEGGLRARSQPSKSPTSFPLSRRERGPGGASLALRCRVPELPCVKRRHGILGR